MGLSPEGQRRVLVVAVGVDLLAVSLVVPLLPARFRELGLSAAHYGFVQSTYSAAQIVGGLGIGYLGDRGLGRRGILLLNFCGAAAAYAIVGAPSAGVAALVFSRVVVGLCKQTMMASTALMADLTAPGPDRALWIGRLSSAAQCAWVAGQSLGGWLNARGSPLLVSCVAVALYALDFCLVAAALPAAPGGGATKEESPKADRAPRAAAPLRSLLSSPAVAGVCATRLALSFAGRAANATRAIYELDRWDLTRGDAAYLSSFKSLVGVLSSWFLAGALTRRLGPATLARGAAAVFVLAALLEAVPAAAYASLPLVPAALGDGPLLSRLRDDPSLLVYAALAFPAAAAATQVSTVSLRATFTEVVPREATARALAALDVALSAVGVAAPLAAAWAFDGVDPQDQPRVAAAFHAAALAVALVAFPAAARRATPGEAKEKDA